MIANHQETHWSSISLLFFLDYSGILSWLICARPCSLVVQVLAVLVLWYLWLVKYGEIAYVDKLVSSIPKTLKKGHCFRFKRLCSEVEKKGDFHPLSARLIGPIGRSAGLSAACGPFGARRLRLAAARQAQLVEGRGDHWSAMSWWLWSGWSFFWGMESIHFPQKILDALLLEIETSIQSEFHACKVRSLWIPKSTPLSAAHY